MSRWMFSVCVAFIIVLFLSTCLVEASIGENLYPYIYCMNDCVPKLCSKAEHSNIECGINKLLKWTCQEECKYNCMWSTVESLLVKNVTIPQFFGKWPFIRIFYMQEVASVIFSALNFLSQAYALYLFQKNVKNNNVYTKLWNFYGLVNLNTWIWSVAFHTRDLPLTEKADYISAFGVVMSFSIILAYRTLHHWPVSVNLFGGLCLLFYFNHASYIMLYKFDYGYNMKVIIFIGSVVSVGWLMWCWKHRHLVYVHHMYKFIFLTGATTILELLDFQPIFWLFDAHAIWHLSTIPLHLLLFRFAIADCTYIIKNKEI